MLGNRQKRSNLGGYFIVRPATRGNPQGVLSSLLCLLEANIGLGHVERRGYMVVAYADDVVILVGGKFLSTQGDLMDFAFGTLPFWATNYNQ